MWSRRVGRALAVIFVGVLLLLALAFATGRLAYATTHGISMLPVFRTGDLVILRAAGSYHVGEIVAYRSPLLHTTVLHRIVAAHNGLFTFKGDNNHWDDPQRLPASAIRGTLLLHLPRGGTYLSWFRSPLHTGLVAGVVFALGALIEGRRLRRHRRVAVPVKAPAGHLSGNWFVAAGLVGLLAFGAVTFFSYRSSPERTSAIPVSYSEQLTFGYRGQAKPGAVYPTGAIVSGEPIFLRLVRSVVVTATWSLHTGATSSLRGTVGLGATLLETNGWSRTLVPIERVPFVGDRATAKIVLPVSTAESLAAHAASETGLAEGGGSVRVVGNVDFDGAIVGGRVIGSMTPAFSFEMDPYELNLSSGANGLGAVDQLTTTKSGGISHPVLVARTVRLVGHRLPIRTVREIGLIGSAAAMLVLLMGIAEAFIIRHLSEEDRLLRGLRDDLVPVLTDPTSLDKPLVEVASLAALAELAERFEAVLLDFVGGVGHAYFAEVGGILYRFSEASVATEPPQVGQVIPLRERPVENAVVEEPAEERHAEVLTLSPTLRVLADEPNVAGLGLNAWFAQEKWREFEQDPLSVPPSWREFFIRGAGRSAASPE